MGDYSLPWPTGDNASDTIINTVHYNLTTLKYWNYTYYQNDTISNNSKCYIAFGIYKPHIYDNGSWYNSTNCYVPINGIGTRGELDIAFACLFGISIMFSLIHLRKHGRQFLREDKRFRIVGRRWQWYWLLFVAACGLISTITGLDVERDYLQSIAIVLQSFFYSLMLPGTLAAVWEATRHWGSWQERQIVDRDIYGLPQDDRRAKTEFWLPLIFYLFAWLNFFMIIPRSWSPLEKQRNPEQQAAIAEPNATDNRMKAGAIIAVLAWFVIIFSLLHSLKHYKPAPATRNPWTLFGHFAVHTPTKLFLAIVVLGIRLAYGIAAAWIFDISIFKYDCQPAWPFALGYGTTFLIVLIFEIAGYCEENEDKQLIQQRRVRGRTIDAELGFVRKPNWWSKDYWMSGLSDEDRFRRMAQRPSDVTYAAGGGHQRQRSQAYGQGNAVELGDLDAGGGLRERSRSRPPDDPFRDEAAVETPTQEAAAALGVQRTYSAATSRTSATNRSDSTLVQQKPVQTRSMLDI